MEWFSDYGSFLNFLVNLGMLIIWAIYLQLFLMAYLRARKPRLIINRGGGSDLNALCIVSNMSEEPIYPQTVYCTLNHAEGACSATITDRELLQKSGDDDKLDGVTMHGPLKRGDFMSLGTFRNLVEITAELSDQHPSEIRDLPDDIESVEIMVVAAFGGDDLEIAAEREYRIDRSTDPWDVIPVDPRTKQISSRSERKQIRRMIVRELNSE